MKNARFIFTLVVVAVLTLLLLSCAGPATPTAPTTPTIPTTPTTTATPTKPATTAPTTTATPTTPATTAVAKPQGTLTVAITVTYPMSYFDPKNWAGGLSYTYVGSIYNGVLQPTPENPGVPSPKLAQSYTVSPDGLVYEFKLRQGVKFHNGDEMTADDVKFSWDRYKGLANTDLKANVKEVTVVDRYTVRFTLNAVWPDFLHYYTPPNSGAGWVVPKKYVESVGDDKFLQAPIGTGPYKFVEIVSGDHFTLEANESYWAGMPHIKTIVYKHSAEVGARLAMLKTGAADIGSGLNAVADAIKQDPNLALVATNVHSYVVGDFIEQWNPKSPWADIRVRKAAALAIDKAAIQKAFMAGIGQVGGSMVPETADMQLSLPPVPYDPAQAIALLKEAGYGPGDIKVKVYPHPGHADKVEAVLSYWKAVGIDATMVTMDSGTFTSMLQTKKFTSGIVVSYHASSEGSAPMHIKRWIIPGGDTSYVPAGAVPQIEDLWKKQSTELDSKKREALPGQIQKIVYDNYYQVTFCDSISLHGVDKNRVVDPSITFRVPSGGGPWEYVQLKQ